MAAVTPEGSTPPAERGYFLISHYMVFPGFFKDSGIPHAARAARSTTPIGRMARRSRS